MAAGGDWEIENDDGFVYKRPRVLYPAGREDAGAAAPSALGPPPESVRLQRRRRALLNLRAKYQAELSRWESLASDVLAPLPAPSAAPSGAPSASPLPPTVSSDHAVLDDYIAEVEVQGKMLEKASRMCDEISKFCDEYETALVDAVTALPIWGNPRELANSLCGSDEQAAVQPVRDSPRELMNLLCSPTEQAVPGTTTT
ncbi:uncharacterized protein LOC124690393 [Lolium rigidum]|uniref:uncharacterized protein LOC124690393 n=1 Tax=Lolium rigidum TaxID=89674 RepID=UPI001F5DF2E9|nr:uncharacterized protein LOC124690393 [Lolium rigidum]